MFAFFLFPSFSLIFLLEPPFLSFSLLQKLISLVSRTPLGPGHTQHLLVLLSFIIHYLMDCSPTPTCSHEPVAGWPQLLPLPSVLQKTLWHVFWARILATSLQGLQPSACGPFLRVLLWDVRQHILPAKRMMTAFHILCQEEWEFCGWYLCTGNINLFTRNAHLVIFLLFVLS